MASGRHKSKRKAQRRAAGREAVSVYRGPKVKPGRDVSTCNRRRSTDDQEGTR